MPNEEPTRAPVDRPGGTPIYTVMVREQRLVETFVSLTDTLVRDFDALEMLTMLCDRSVELLGVADAGILLIDGGSRAGDDPVRLSVAAASSERSRLLETMAATVAVGPCIDCLRTGEPVVSEDLAVERRWPDFCAKAREVGFRAVHAVPLRLREDTLGVLTLLDTEPGVLAGPEARLGQALADAATIGLLHHRALRRAEAVVGHLEGALASRVVIEQAKGVLAARTGGSPDDAFVLLRRHARRSGEHLTDLARRVVEGGVDAGTVLDDDDGG
ncbi:ANTAR domain-containing protein [Actinomycetospora atypica]|uniref:ANTAR domain-containing protein n=1 Tax=Actinomycetospora atypica TaxID=1290095 RepID=A0ABV9YGT3_9PSEU